MLKARIYFLLKNTVRNAFFTVNEAHGYERN